MISLKKSIVLFILWALFARWYYVCNIKNLCPRTSGTVPAKVSDHELYREGDTAFQNTLPKTLDLLEDGRRVIKGREQIKFEPYTAKLSLTTDNDTYLKEVQSYVLADASRSLTITGYYLSREVDAAPAGYANMGLARAAALKDKLVQMGLSSEKIQLAAVLLYDASLTKSAEFYVKSDMSKIPNTYMIQK
jgi:outer membrane protein OmpA-like peptidoglycan-associated protein